MNGGITRKQLVDLLRDLVGERRTTTLYVHTNDNHLIAVGLERGEIVSLICGPRQGERAIAQIRKMRSGTYRLDDKVMTHRRSGTSLPSSETLLTLLTETDAAEQASGADDCAWVHDVLCKVLKIHMGPIAPVVCRETVEAAGGIDSPAKLRQVVDELAREIDDTAEAERFRAQVHSELGSALG